MEPLYEISQINEPNFSEAALRLFRYQYRENHTYQAYCKALHISEDDVTHIEKIPFLPISFFKTHKIQTGSFEPQQIFESSSTTGMIPAKHYIRSVKHYEESFLQSFEQFYGSPEKYCFLGLLPSYLERKNSSLIYMVHSLIEKSKHPESGFYLYEWEELAEKIKRLESLGQPVFLIGVTYALLDFAERYPMHLQHTIVVETGGMKGRKEEMTREEVHTILREKFQVNNIHSEYGMAELLSQAWSQEKGIFTCPPWMKVLPRADDDPLQTLLPVQKTSGIINIIDLANTDSCAFIATDDIGIVYPNGSFEITGRLDAAELRGCGLLLREGMN